MKNMKGGNGKEAKAGMAGMSMPKGMGMEGHGFHAAFDNPDPAPAAEMVPAPVKRLADATVRRDAADREYWQAREEHDKYLKACASESGMDDEDKHGNG